MNYLHLKEKVSYKVCQPFLESLSFYNQTGSKAVVFYIETVPVIPTVLLKTIRSIYTTMNNKSNYYISEIHPLPKGKGFLSEVRLNWQPRSESNRVLRIENPES